MIVRFTQRRAKWQSIPDCDISKAGLRKLTASREVMSSDNIQVETRLDLPDLGEGHDLHRILSSALKRHTALQPAGEVRAQAFWPAAHFKLDRVAIYRDAHEEERRSILKECSRDILEEAYYIEKCGMYFASKMGLLAESAQERMLYSLFAADETIHFSWISRYVSAETAADFIRNPFIKLLDEILRDEDKITLTYVIQVILEGWGISHYRALSKDCNDSGLIEVFDRIGKDEALHHSSGIVLFNERRLSMDRIESLAEVLNRLFFMVRVGPQAVVSKIEKIRGHLSRTQKIKIFQEMGSEEETARKIEILKSLIGSAGYAEPIFDELDRSGAFKPFSAVECAGVSG